MMNPVRVVKLGSREFLLCSYGAIPIDSIIRIEFKDIGDIGMTIESTTVGDHVSCCSFNKEESELIAKLLRGE